MIIGATAAVAALLAIVIVVGITMGFTWRGKYQVEDSLTWGM